MGINEAASARKNPLAGQPFQGKKRGPSIKGSFLCKALFHVSSSLAKVSLQQAFKRTSMSSFVFCHFVNSVMDRI